MLAFNFKVLKGTLNSIPRKSKSDHGGLNASRHPKDFFLYFYFFAFWKCKLYWKGGESTSISHFTPRSLHLHPCSPSPEPECSWGLLGGWAAGTQCLEPSLLSLEPESGSLAGCWTPSPVCAAVWSLSCQASHPPGALLCYTLFLGFAPFTFPVSIPGSL